MQYANEMVDLWELVEKLSNREEALSSKVVKGLAFDFEVENLRLLLVAKDQELLERKQKHCRWLQNTSKLWKSSIKPVLLRKVTESFLRLLRPSCLSPRMLMKRHRQIWRILEANAAYSTKGTVSGELKQLVISKSCLLFLGSEICFGLVVFIGALRIHNIWPSNGSSSTLTQP